MTDAETYYAKCTACGWRVEFDQGSFLPNVDLEESARKRIAGHSGHHDCTSADHDYGPVGSEHEEVLEVQAITKVTFHLPLDDGDDPQDAIAQALGNAAHARHVSNVDIQQIYKQEKY